MADVSAPPSTFSRGSAVLDYWLAHAEGLTVQPLGARVEEVVAGAPVGHAEALIVRSRMTRRRRAIPTASIVAVEPSSGRLLMDMETEARPRLHTLRPSHEQISAARVHATRSQQFARAHAVAALRLTRTGSVATLSWLRPRAVRASKTTAHQSRVAAAHTANGVAWVTPRLIAGARTAAAAAARVMLTTAVLVARGVGRAARELERATAFAAERGRASLESRRLRRDNDSSRQGR
jgi:hypothetical protein